MTNIESQDIPETENTLGLDGGEAKFYVYIQSTTMERPDLERTMEQVLPYAWKEYYLKTRQTIQVGSGKLNTSREKHF